MANQEINVSNRKNRKTGPKPAPDHGVDSAEILPPAPSPSPTHKPVASHVAGTPVTPSTEGSQPPAAEDTELDKVVVQLNSRIANKYKLLLSRLSKETGKTIRSLIEEALEEKYLSDKR